MALAIKKTADCPVVRPLCPLNSNRKEVKTKYVEGQKVACMGQVAVGE